ncbi:transposase [Streptomyces klenkii]|uniref:transposase n=1 Tax=Streptomyces klenkii TaxID=1420899 RepID=UPI003414832F
MFLEPGCSPGCSPFELADALLCTDGRVTAPADLMMVAEHRRGHGALYGALNRGSADVPQLRQVLPAHAPGRRRAPGARGRHQPWLRPGAPTSAVRLFCHVCGRNGRSSDQCVPGWPYSLGQGGGARWMTCCCIRMRMGIGPVAAVTGSMGAG